MPNQRVLLPAFTHGSRILFQGDSITDGNRGRNADLNHILGHGFVFIIAARHGAAFPEMQLDFVNRGISGNTVLDLKERWQKDTLDVSPDLLSIMVGVNDAGQGVPLEQYAHTYQELLKDARSANPKLKLVLCAPFVRPREYIDPDIVKRHQIVAELAREHRAAFVDMQPVFDEAAKRAPAEYWIWDDVHPTFSGHQLIADEWERVVGAFWQ